MDAETAFTTVALLLMVTRTSQVYNIFGRITPNTLRTNLRVLKQLLALPHHGRLEHILS